MATRRQQQTTTEEPEGLQVETLDHGPDGDDDEGTTTTTPPPATQQPSGVRAGERMYTEAELRAEQERARQQEKDKLYGRLDTQDQTLKRLQEDLDRREANEAARVKAEQEAQAAKDREELTAKDLLERQNADWERRFEVMQQEREADRALLAREAQYQELQATRLRMLSEADADNTIAPQLLDYVGGNTPEEIAQSIAMAQSKSADILTEVQTRQQQMRQGMKGASVTQPPVGPMETDQAYETITKETLDKMSMADYARNRPKLLAAASRARFGAQQ